MGRVIAVALALFFISGCRDSGPEVVAREFVAALDGYTAMPSPARLEAVVGLLDGATRQALRARAAAASALLGGGPVEPWDLLRFDGFVQGERLVRVEEIAVDEDRARVGVQTAWAAPAAVGGPGEAPPVHELLLVREDGGWRVSLPDLARTAHGEGEAR